MTDLRTAAQQALEAMEEACEIIGAAWAWRDEKGKPTITALRAALAQQAEPVACCDLEERKALSSVKLPCDVRIGHGTHRKGSSLLALVVRSRSLYQMAKSDDYYGYASRLAVAIWEKHYKDAAPQWTPLDDLMGVLTQIDNMTSGLTRLAQQAEPKPMHPELRKMWEDYFDKCFRAMPVPQQAEPVEPNRWEGDHDIESPNNACMHKSYCMALKRARVPVAQQAEPFSPDAIAHTQVAWKMGFDAAKAEMQQAEPVEPVGTKALTHEAIADALSKGAPLAGDQRAVLLGLVADDKVWQRECDRLQAELAALRAAPPQRKPLTDEDAAALIAIDRRMLKEFGAAPSGAAMELIRRTERAHGIGGQE